jgi:transcriptional regulator with XRE-family HTH domain
MEEQELRGILGNNISRCRKQENLTQAELAEKLDISANFLSNIERCINWISPDTLVKLATTFNVEPFELLKADAFLSEKENDILKSYAEENIKAVLSVVNQMGRK